MSVNGGPYSMMTKTNIQGEYQFMSAIPCVADRDPVPHPFDVDCTSKSGGAYLVLESIYDLY